MRLLFVFCCIFVHLAFCHDDAALQVQTTTGVVQGIIKSSPYGNVRAFLGIPYADPPVGDKRFRPSMPVTPWLGILNVTKVMPACIQKVTPVFGMSEDCLTLNVYTPVNSSGVLPVMIWIHGGSFVSGSGGEYDPSALVINNAIVVTINYRLGPFGFLQSQLIRQENPTYPTLGGMNAIADQMLAIYWVKANALAFGGDPNAITLFGESAGSLSLCLLVASPIVKKGLFLRVIFESGSCLGPWGPLPSDLGLQRGEILFNHFNAKSLADLRKISTNDFLNYENFSIYVPAVDLVFLPVLPQFYYENYSVNVPDGGAVVVGSNSLDTLFVPPYYLGPLPGTSQQFYEILVNFFGEDAPTISQKYPTSSGSNPTNDVLAPQIAFQTMNAHLCVNCPSRDLAAVFQQHVPTFIYQFSFNPADGLYKNMSPHFGEVPLVFGTPVFPFPYNGPLSSVMGKYWTAFARTGIPSGGNGELAWPNWNSSHQHINFNSPSSVENGFKDDYCGFWTNYMGNPKNATRVLRVAEYCFFRKL